MDRAGSKHFLLCVRNDGYAASLEVRKIYEKMPDPAAGKLGLVRVIDESNEDYLYPADFFAAINVPKTAAMVFAFVPRRNGASHARPRAHTPRAHSAGRSR